MQFGYEIDRRLLRKFGLEKMGFFHSKTCRMFQEDIEDGFLNNKLLVIAGEIGAMKSSLFHLAMGNHENECKFVFVRNLYKEMINISSIMNAMIYQLSSENPRRDLEARTDQLTRIVGEEVVNRKSNVVVVIEEAHRLHNSIFRALKELRELSYRGQQNLFSIVLIGHPQLVTTVSSRKEAYWRSSIIEMNEANGWMTFDERVSYIRNVFGHAITPDAAKTIASLCRMPLEIVHYVGAKMAEANRTGKTVLDSEVVKPTNSELAKASNLSIRSIAKAAGLGVATVQQHLHQPDSKFSDSIRAAINHLRAENENRKSA